MILNNESELRELYGFPNGRAEEKVQMSLDKHSLNFISKSPFLVLSTTDKLGKMDASPRGGEPGFVKVLNNELLIPDFKGNNRIDSLINISETNTVGLLFMIPGIDETLRVNGNAMITTSSIVLNEFSKEQKLPISSIVVTIDEVFLHCAKAFMRSKLWDPSSQINANDFPTMGEMLKDQLNSPLDAESRDDMIKRYRKDI